MASFAALADYSSSDDEAGPGVAAKPQQKKQPSGDTRQDLRSLAFTSAKGVTKKKKGKKGGKVVVQQQQTGTPATQAQTPASTAVEQPAVQAAPVLPDKRVEHARAERYQEEMREALEQSLREAKPEEVQAVWTTASGSKAAKAPRKQKGRKAKGKIVAVGDAMLGGAAALSTPPGLQTTGARPKQAAASSSTALPGVDAMLAEEMQRVQLQEAAVRASKNVNLEAARTGAVAYDRSRGDVQPMQGAVPQVEDSVMQTLPVDMQQAVRTAAQCEEILRTKGRGGVGAAQVPRSVPVGTADLMQTVRSMSLLFRAASLAHDQAGDARRRLAHHEQLMQTGLSASQANLSQQLMVAKAESASLARELGALHRDHAKALAAMRAAGVDVSQLTASSAPPPALPGIPASAPAPAASQGKRGGKKGTKAGQRSKTAGVAASSAATVPYAWEASDAMGDGAAPAPKLNPGSVASLNMLLSGSTQ